MGLVLALLLNGARLLKKLALTQYLTYEMTQAHGVCLGHLFGADGL